uniref:Ig-like domain-containing protein n=1 Tax=Hucho hucho TaxID=62062 RepID=A0A4W5JMV1_9TELE
MINYSLQLKYLTHVMSVSPPPLMEVHSGENVTLQCINVLKTPGKVSWFKQVNSSEPLCITSMWSSMPNVHHYNGFQVKRMKMFTTNGTIFLKITEVDLSDSGTYYCGSSYSNKMEFGEGAILIVEVKEKKHDCPGDSVQYCTIHTETCAGEHCVYWFRHGSGESRPGIIYTHGDRSDQCEKTPEAFLVYNLPKRNLSPSDAGTYYCDVASCGEILFGNGNKLYIKDNGADPLLLVYCLSAALGLLLILIIVLGSTNMNKRRSLQCRGKKYPYYIHIIYSSLHSSQWRSVPFKMREDLFYYFH